LGLHETIYGALEETLVVLFSWPANKEACGLVTWYLDSKQLDLYLVPNRHEEPINNFTMYQRDVDDVLVNATGVMVAVFHTHIGADNIDPSPCDYAELALLRKRQEYRRCYGILFHNRTRTLTTYHERGVIRSYVVPMAKFGSGN
jgi:hypothetical protein